MRTQRLFTNCLIAAATSVPLLVACGGQVSLGTNKSQLELIDPVAVAGTVPACNPGSAHPNVCCEAGPGKSSQCGVFPGQPFQPCDSGYTTYPDPRSCCSFDNPSSCTSPPVNPPPNQGGSCGYQCDPGWYPIQNGCCRQTDGGAGECYGWASDGGVPDGGVVVDGGNVDGGVFDGGVDAGEIDAGDVDGGCATSSDGGTSCDPQPPTCDYACPSGWQHPSGAPDICCRDVGGQIECFSQATGPSSGPGSVDGGVADSGTSSTDASPSPLSCGGNSNGDCSCQATVGGHTYELQCSDSARVCTCIEDGVGTTTTGVMACGADGGPSTVISFWTNDCHFPR